MILGRTLRPLLVLQCGSLLPVEHTKRKRREGRKPVRGSRISVKRMFDEARELGEPECACLHFSSLGRPYSASSGSALFSQFF